LAFHPYPQVIAAVFNRRAFGPPRGLTPASACPRIAHPASRPRRGTQVALLRLAFASAPFRLTSPRASDSLAHSTKGTPSLHKGAPTARGRTVSGTVSLPSRGAFHLSLTVLVRYRSLGSTQAWMVVHPGSDRVSRARPYSGTASRRPVWVRVRGCHPLRPALPCRSAPQPDLRPGAAAPGCAALQPRRRNPCRVCPLDGLAIGPLSLAATQGSLEIDFLSSGYLDVSVPRVPPPPAYVFSGGICTLLCMGSPIRRPPGRRMCAPRRGLSQLAASFIGSLCQGIRRAPVVSCGTASGPRDIHVSLN